MLAQRISLSQQCFKNWAPGIKYFILIPCDLGSWPKTNQISFLHVWKLQNVGDAIILECWLTISRQVLETLYMAVIPVTVAELDHSIFAVILSQGNVYVGQG